MKRNYDLKFYDLVSRCFMYLEENCGGEWFVPYAKETILYLWDADALKIEDATIVQEIVRKLMLERLDGESFEKFVKSQTESGWFLDVEDNAVDLFRALLTPDEDSEFFEDGERYVVILD